MGIFSAFFIFSILDSAFLGDFKGGPNFLEPAEPEPSEPDFETEPLEPEPFISETEPNRTGVLLLVGELHEGQES